MDGQVHHGVSGFVFENVSTAMLGLRSSNIGAVIQDLPIALYQVAERKEVMVARTTRQSSLVTTNRENILPS